MAKRITCLFLSIASACTLGPALPALAQADAATASRPNLTRAARLTFVAGAVRVQRSDNTGDDAAVLNMPIPEASRIVTADYGQAELEFEDGSVVRITPNSTLALNVLTLESGNQQSAQVAHSELTLLGGLAYFELRKSPASTWLLSAGGVRLQPLENLTLRLSFDEPPPVFAMLTGAARATSPEGIDADIRAGETLRPDAKDAGRYFLAQQISTESWDAWNESRDQAAADAADRRTAARDNYAGGQGYGWSDLDSSGSWYDVPGTGQVWQPYNADEGFDPYGYGSWVWGNGAYVWASGYQWGWTPFRCGHWEYFPSFGWGWQPDARCSIWSFAGGGYLTTGLGGYGGGYAGDYGGGGGTYYGTGIFIRGPHPPRTPLPTRPQPRPGQPHPVVPVRGPDGPRPPIVHRGQVRIAGSTVTALPSVAPSSSRSGNALGSGIARDFPIDRATRQPILGTQSLPPAYSSIPGTAERNPQRSGSANRSPRPVPEQGLTTPGTYTPGAYTPGIYNSPTPTGSTAHRPADSPDQPGRNGASPMGTGRIPVTTRIPSQGPSAPPLPAPAPQPVQTIRPTPPAMQQQQQSAPRYDPPPMQQQPRPTPPPMQQQQSPPMPPQMQQQSAPRYNPPPSAPSPSSSPRPLPAPSPK